MSEPIPGLLNPTRLLFELQQGHEIAQRFSGCLEPDAIARQVTEGLVEKFGCAFARIWLIEPDGTALRLVASSGMYTHLDGAFARVPMGAYKVGKIAQNRVPFLSNNLAHEPWVKDRDWAIANGIRGFAGYPLAAGDRIVGVLAAFSHHPLAPEFLEMLQMLAMTMTIALDAALQYQQQTLAASLPSRFQIPLSDQLAPLLKFTRLTLVGTERPLGIAATHLLLQAGEVLQQLACSYCRLTYSADSVLLEALLTLPDNGTQVSVDWPHTPFGDLSFASTCLGGRLQTQIGPQQRVLQLWLQLPDIPPEPGRRVQVQCRQAVLQAAFVQLVYQAGFRLDYSFDPTIPRLTDIWPNEITQPILWIQSQGIAPPKGIQALVDFSVQPDQLRQAIAAVMRGETWGLPLTTEPSTLLSEREQEVLSLMAQGLRDRDIARYLHISESTVKFHVNNTLTKLRARNRYQALYQATVNGWIQA